MKDFVVCAEKKSSSVVYHCDHPNSIRNCFFVCQLVSVYCISLKLHSAWISCCATTTLFLAHHLLQDRIYHRYLIKSVMRIILCQIGFLCLCFKRHLAPPVPRHYTDESQVMENTFQCKSLYDVRYAPVQRGA